MVWFDLILLRVLEKGMHALHGVGWGGVGWVDGWLPIILSSIADGLICAGGLLILLRVRKKGVHYTVRMDGCRVFCR